MVPQLSDAELEIMKIVWGNPEEVTLFPYILEGLAARGRPCQKNTLIVLLSRLMKKGFLHAKKNRPAERIHRPDFRGGVPDGPDPVLPGQNL